MSLLSIVLIFTTLPTLPTHHLREEFKTARQLPLIPSQTDFLLIPISFSKVSILFPSEKDYLHLSYMSNTQCLLLMTIIHHRYYYDHNIVLGGKLVSIILTHLIIFINMSIVPPPIDFTPTIIATILERELPSFVSLGYNLGFLTAKLFFC